MKYTSYLYRVVLLGIVLLCSDFLMAQTLIHPKISGPGDLWVNSYNGVLFSQHAYAARTAVLL